MIIRGGYMKKSILSVLLLISSSTFAQSNDSFIKQLDDRANACSNNAQNTIESVDCRSKALADWDKELNTQYKLLMNEQSTEFKNALRKSQRAWITYRDSYNSAMNAFYGQQQGTIWGIVYSDSKVRVTRDRAIELYKLRVSTNMEG